MLKRLTMVAGLLLALGGAAHAETTCGPAGTGENKQQEYQRLLDCTRQSILDAKARLNFLSDMKMDELEASLERERDILNGLIETRNAALNAANEDNAKLKAANDELTRELAAANQANEEANARIEALQAEVERLAADLKDANTTIDEANGRIAALQAVIDQLQAQLTELNVNLKASKEQQAALEKKIDGLTTALDDANKNVTAQAEKLGGEIGDLRTALDEANKQIDALNAHIDELNAALAGAQAKIAELSAKLDQTKTALDQSNEKISALQNDIAGLQKTIADLNAKLKVATDRICALTDRLGPFVVQFVVGLKALFPDDPNIFIVDDRLVVAAEVLFPTASDKIEAGGDATLDKAAHFISTFPDQIPADIPWIVQINGHTDVRPIHTRRFPSNWELSTARAVAVVNYLHDKGGIPSDRLAAAGYSQYHPIAEGNDQESLHRNRRIEIQLTGHDAWIAAGASATGCAN